VFFATVLVVAAFVRILRMRIVVEMKLDDDDVTVEKGLKGCFELAALLEEAKRQMICTLITFET
jgi:hypothetical protein